MISTTSSDSKQSTKLISTKLTMLLTKLHIRNMLLTRNVVFAIFLLLALLNRGVEVTAEEVHDYNDNEGDYNIELHKRANTSTTSGQEQTTDMDVESKPEQAAESNQTMPHFPNSTKLYKIYTKPTGNSITFNCTAVGTPEPTITWLRNGTKVHRRMGRVQHSRWTITMEDLLPDDSDIYTCRVCNPIGCIEQSMKLLITGRVNHKPIVSTPPDRYLTDLTSKQVWSFALCDSNPGCSLQINQEDIKRFESENITPDDAAWYACIESNCLGRFLSIAYLRAVNDSYPFEPNVTKIMRGDVMWVMTVILLLTEIEI